MIDDLNESPSNVEVVMDTVNRTPEENARVIVEMLQKESFILHR